MFGCCGLSELLESALCFGGDVLFVSETVLLCGNDDLELTVWTAMLVLRLCR